MGDAFSVPFILSWSDYRHVRAKGNKGMGVFQFPSKSRGVVYILRIKAYSNKTWVKQRLSKFNTIPSKRICKLGHVTFNGYFSRKKLKLEMAKFYNSSQSKKLQPNVSLDERLDICARALLNNVFRV